MASKNGSGPDPAQLQAQIEATRADLAATIDEIAERVSPKRVAARTKERVAAAVKTGTEAVKDGVEVVKDKVGRESEPLPPTEPLADRAPTDGVLPPTAAVPLGKVDLSGPPRQAAVPRADAGGGTGAPAPAFRPEYAGAGAALLLLVLVLWRRRATRRRSGSRVARKR